MENSLIGWLSAWMIFALLISFFILYFERRKFVRTKHAFVYLIMFFAGGLALLAYSLIGIR
jgi:hypothetical protein